MRFLYKALAAAVVGLAVFASAAPAVAAETSNSEFVIIPEDTVFPEDLYAGAIRVVVDGRLEGDLMAFAAEEIVINGTVTGSVTAVSPVVTVNGEVGGSLRTTGNRLDISGEVIGDVVAAVVNADLSDGSSVSGEVILWAWDASVLGSIGADLTGTQRHLDIAGEIDGDVDVSVTELRIVGDLVVGGDLGYRSDAEAEGLNEASVEGAIVKKSPMSPNVRLRALGLLGRLLVVLFLSMAALSAAFGWSQRTMASIAEVGRAPIRRWLIGAPILFSPLIAVGVTWLILSLAPPAASFPLLIVLVPVILALVGLALALAVVAGTPTVGWLGGILFKRLDIYGATLVGSLIVGVVWYLPIVGWLVPVIVLPVGLGAWMASGQSQAPGLASEDGVL